MTVQDMDHLARVTLLSQQGGAFAALCGSLSLHSTAWQLELIKGPESIGAQRTTKRNARSYIPWFLASWALEPGCRNFILMWGP